MMENYDVIVIGGGPGGYVAAIRAAQLGKKVACVEMYKHNGKTPALGGTCLNIGCIPSKVLLETSEHFDKLSHLETHGISLSEPSINIATMLTRKESISAQLTGGINQLFKANGVAWIQGRGKLTTKDTVQVTDFDDNKTDIKANNIILAPGSVPIDIPVAKMDDEHIVDSTGALNFTEIPNRLGVIGAGVIGLELGSVWHRLGSEVTIIEAADKLLPMIDQEVAKDAGRQFKQQKLNIKLKSMVKGAQVKGNEVMVTYEDSKGEQTITVDKLLVCVGRRPNTANLLDSNIGIALDERGFITVDDHCRTAIPNIFAVGDAVRGPMLAHKASEEGVMVAEIIAGQAGHVNLNLVPNIIYTQPEIAAVGKTEEQLKADKVNYKKGDFPFAANGRAKAMDADKGRVKILADAETDEILGGHIVGPMASELIQELVVAMEYKAASEDIARICHGHPGLGEAIHEAALAVDGRALHKINK
ncbi:MAG: dihydrolipoyl dehydrogenase [Ostreibacterium sp.]